MAGSSVGGDFEKLDELEQRFRRLASQGAFRPLLEDLSEAFLQAIEKGFAATTDPYLRTWAPLASGEARPVLTKTGSMRAAFLPRVENDRIIIRNPIRDSRGRLYANYHQTGTYRMPQRMMVPARGDPERGWRELMRFAQEAVRKIMGQ